MELMTAVNYDLPITVVMFNNATMGLIRKNQFQNYDEHYIDCDFVNPDYRRLAESFGFTHQRIQNEQDIQRVFDSVDFLNGRTLIEIMLDRDVFPNYSSRRH
jgi:acetolactate synthase-1/2/3 large subunit